MSITSIEVQEVRRALGLEVGEFARLLGVDERSVVKWEADAARPTASAEAVIHGIAEALRRRPDLRTAMGTEFRSAARVGGLAYLMVRFVEAIWGGSNNLQTAT